MMKSILISCLTLLFLCSNPTDSKSQGKIEDYQRAELFNGLMQNKIYHAPTNIKWLTGKKQYFYNILTAKGTEYVLVDVNSLTQTSAFDQNRLATELSSAASTKLEAFKLPISNVVMNSDATELSFNYDGKQWTYDLATFKCREVVRQENQRQTGYSGDRPSDALEKKVKSPDGKWNAYIKNYNVYIKGIEATAKEFQLSFDGSEGEYYNTELAWSPDSKKLATYKVRPAKPHLIYLIESSPTTQLQPILQSRNYLKPGDALTQMQPALFLTDAKKQVAVDQNKIQSGSTQCD
ncbi:MAG: hypothetical protein EOO91_14010 [Pedobacter sp.]|nr:MAG: hypothetical protein EOO91_14010 [Pedobacter sp.]